jgi:putative redox protein
MPQENRDLSAATGSVGEVVVTETGIGRLQQSVEAAGHRLLADEPVGNGGGGTGPDPYDLLLAALGACTSMTLRLYADRKGWPLDRVRVILGHRKIHAEDCRDCETRIGLVDEIDREIELVGALDGEQRARLLQIAEHCPVHRTLQSEVVIRTRERRIP